MVHRYIRSPRRLLVISAFAILALSAYGFAASNNVAGSNAGDGSGVVSGFDISNITYSLNVNGNIDGVEFDITSPAPATAEVAVEFQGVGGTVLAGGALSASTCTADASGHAICSGSNVNVLAFTILRVIAVD